MEKGGKMHFYVVLVVFSELSLLSQLNNRLSCVKTHAYKRAISFKN